MQDPKSKSDSSRVDTKEFEIPETLFIRDIENTVFQSIVVQCLSQIEGISLVEGNFIDNILGRGPEGVTGIYAEQDEKNHSINIKAEVNILFGLPIPQKAEEIQTKIAEEITKMTGLHVGSVHVVFKNVLTLDQLSKIGQSPLQHPSDLVDSNMEEEYSDEF